MQNNAGRSGVNSLAQSGVSKAFVDDITTSSRSTANNLAHFFVSRCLAGI